MKFKKKKKNKSPYISLFGSFNGGNNKKISLFGI